MHLELQTYILQMSRQKRLIERGKGFRGYKYS